MEFFAYFILYLSVLFWICALHYFFLSVYCHIKKRRRNYKRCFYSDCPKYLTCKYNKKVLMDL